MIKKLTKEQESKLPGYVREWTDIGLCTDPADRETAETGVRLAYAAAKLPPPERIVWCGSPMGNALTRAILSVGESVGESVRDSVCWDSVWASVGDSVRASVGESVRASVRDNVWDRVRASVWDSVRDSVWDSVWASVYGQHDASWLGVYDFFRQVTGLKAQTAKLRGLTELAKSAGWAIPHANICWVSDRHHVLCRDERGRLHNLTAPALMYPDGWAIYAVHGVRVPADIIENPQGITVKRIEDEANAEIRRVMLERFGWSRYLVESGAKEIATDKCGSLYRKEIPGDEPLVMVKVRNSSPEPDGSFKDYFLRVPPTMGTARQAVAWTFGLRPSEYRPQVES